MARGCVCLEVGTVSETSWTKLSRTRKRAVLQWLAEHAEATENDATAHDSYPPDDAEAIRAAIARLQQL
jgi:hypothetical protein